MVDIVSEPTRRRMMSGIKGKDTKPELQVRRLLFARGFRYRLHAKALPGKPDLVLAKHRAVVFIHGCFWHRHDCHLFKWPSTREEFWREKINGNVERDQCQKATLKAQGWRIAVVWECALKGRTRLPERDVGNFLEEWLLSCQSEIQIQGTIPAKAEI